MLLSCFGMLLTGVAVPATMRHAWLASSSDLHELDVHTLPMLLVLLEADSLECMSAG